MEHDYSVLMIFWEGITDYEVIRVPCEAFLNENAVMRGLCCAALFETTQ